MKQNEHLTQCAVIRWFRYQYPNEILFAIPNGGARNIVTATKLKAEGVLAGVADLFLMTPKNGKAGLFLELKAKGGRVTDAQKEFLNQAKNKGYESAVCFGIDEAIKTISDYLEE